MDLVPGFAADLAVCRAGGTTVTELAVLGVPAVIVPLPIGPATTRARNAGPLVRPGAAGVSSPTPSSTPPAPSPRSTVCWPVTSAARSDAAAPSVGLDAAAAVADLVGDPCPPPVGTAPTGERPSLDLSVPRHIHIVAIGGAGMSGIAAAGAVGSHRHRQRRRRLTHPGLVVCRPGRRVGRSRPRLVSSDLLDGRHQLRSGRRRPEVPGCASDAACCPAAHRPAAGPGCRAAAVGRRHARQDHHHVAAGRRVGSGGDPSFLTGPWSPPGSVSAGGGGLAPGSRADGRRVVPVRSPRWGDVTNVGAGPPEFWGGWDGSLRVPPVPVGHRRTPGGVRGRPGRRRSGRPCWRGHLRHRPRGPIIGG